MARTTIERKATTAQSRRSERRKTTRALSSRNMAPTDRAAHSIVGHRAVAVIVKASTTDASRMTMASAMKMA